MTLLRSGVKLSLMKKFILFIFFILLTNVNASDLTKSLSNSPTIPFEAFSQTEFQKAKKYGTWHVPFKVNPDIYTLRYYLFTNLFLYTPPNKYNTYSVEPSQNPYEFKFDVIEDKFVKKQLQTKGILSYLYFEDDKIIIDELSPKDRLGKFLNNETKFRSNSMGKSLASYVLGHAICEGYIDSVDSRINDWDLVKNTLYENHKLIDLLNMASGDQKHVYDSHMLENGKVNRFDRNGVDIYTTKARMSVFFQNTKPIKKKYNYNVINTNLVLNYVLLKTGDNFQKLLDKIFREKAKTKEIVYFSRFPRYSSLDGNALSMFHATRLDYLRIAKAMLDDYQNNTFVGKYLKEIYDRRIPKHISDHGGNRGEPMLNRHLTYYGGQFHFPKNKIVFNMSGFLGQHIAIDMENSRIVVVNSVHYNHSKYKYNHKKLLINPIKLGKKSFKK